MEMSTGFVSSGTASLIKTSKPEQKYNTQFDWFCKEDSVDSVFLVGHLGQLIVGRESAELMATHYLVTYEQMDGVFIVNVESNLLPASHLDLHFYREGLGNVDQAFVFRALSAAHFTMILVDELLDICDFYIKSTTELHVGHIQDAAVELLSVVPTDKKWRATRFMLGEVLETSKRVLNRITSSRRRQLQPRRIQDMAPLVEPYLVSAYGGRSMAKNGLVINNRHVAIHIAYEREFRVASSILLHVMSEVAQIAVQMPDANWHTGLSLRALVMMGPSLSLCHEVIVFLSRHKVSKKELKPVVTKNQVCCLYEPRITYHVSEFLGTT